MKILIVIILALFGLIQIQAQPLTLEAAMNQAVDYNHNLKNQTLRIAIAEKNIDKARAQRMPTVTGNGDLRYNPILQTIVVPGDAFGQTGGTTQQVRFGTNFNLLLGVDATYKLYDPTYQTNMDIHRAEVLLETANLRQLNLDVRLETATAYYDLALQQIQQTLAAERLRRANDLLAIEQTRLAAGVVLPVDLRRSELDRQNAQTLLEQAQRNAQRSRLNLARLLGMAPEEIIFPADALQLDSTMLALPLSNADVPDNRAEIIAAQQRILINDLQVRQEDRRYQPSLDLFANLSAQHLSDDLAVWNNWFPFSFVGVRLSVPIFDGNLKTRNKESYQLQQQLNRNELARLRDDLRYELRSAALELENAIAQLRSGERNLATARELQATDQTRYQEGALLLDELRRTEFALREAESNYLAAVQNCLVAQLRWQRANSDL